LPSFVADEFRIKDGLEQTAPAFPEALDDQLLRRRAVLEQRVAELSQKAAAATADRQAAEGNLAPARAVSSEIELQYSNACAEFKEAAAALESVFGQSDRKLAELTASEGSTRRKYSEASEAVLRFKTAEDFTRRSRSQAEEHLESLRTQLADLTAQVAAAEARAGEERVAEERAARERVSAEEKAVELRRALDRISMERAMHEERAGEQQQERLGAEAKVSATRAVAESLAARLEEAHVALAELESACAAKREWEEMARAEFDRARIELQTFCDTHEQALVELHLASLREAEGRAAHDLAAAEQELRRLTEAQEQAALERARLLERLRGPIAPPYRELPEAGPMSRLAQPIQTQIGHFDAGSAPSGDTLALERGKPSFYTVGRADGAASSIPTDSSGALALSAQAETNGDSAARQSLPPRQLDGVKLTSIEDRVDSLTFLKWGKRNPLALPPEPSNGEAAPPSPEAPPPVV
jgi:hypothetical protein